GLVVAVECIFTWYWLADLCAREGIDFVLGHALYMTAIHGGKAKNDRIDAQKIATLLRGGMLPQAYAYPAGMRATRDLLRRRLHLVRKRGQLLAHIQMTAQQYNLPPLGKRIAYPANREGVARRFPDRVVRQSIELDLALLERTDALVTEIELSLVRQAKQHHPQAFQLLRSIPGVGKILALTILYEIHDITRFDRVQEFASYARQVKCAQESAGKKHGTSGAKMGNVHLKWAFSEAAVLFVRHSAEGKKLLARLEKRFGKGKALSILAHKLGRAVYFVLQRGKAFDRARFIGAMT
ncbi:MAG: IS110 family transposase, partial [Myxococcota bacterium]